ncbi:putative acetyltransferase [Microbacterium sp. HJ5]
MVNLPPVGHRVVVRYLLPTGQATDALGELLEADARAVVVDGKRGVERIPVADIIAAKEVPPAPAPRHRRPPGEPGEAAMPTA